MKHTFNVICVTKRSSNIEGPATFHLDIQGEAVVNTEDCTCVFQGETYTVENSGEGLDGTVLVISIKTTRPQLQLFKKASGVITIKVHQFSYDVWDLYTDTPAGDKTPEEIKKKAYHAINRLH